MINKNSVLIGSDIEVFYRDNKTGLLRTAEGHIQGTKYEPYKLEKEGCCTQLDNVSAEFNVPPVRLDQADLMYENIQFVLDYLQKKAPKDYTVECCSSGSFPLEDIFTDNGQTFGCEPDYLAWEDGMENLREPSDDPYLRSCGGHIHIGYEQPNEEVSKALIRALDVMVGVPSVLLDPDQSRRKLYGKAGSFRFKPYGVEYRVLSNFWIKDLNLVRWLFLQIEKAIDLVNSNTNLDPDGLLVYQAINNSNENAVHQICIKHNVDDEF